MSLFQFLVVRANPMPVELAEIVSEVLDVFSAATEAALPVRVRAC